MLTEEQVDGTVALRDVSFRYVPDRPLIEDFNLSVQPGQRVAIVGPTGCGKTTLINLLMRFYDVDGGSIAVDGTDIRRHHPALPAPQLRHGAPGDLAQERHHSGEHRLRQARRQPRRRSWRPPRPPTPTASSRRLPQGYDTVIGEDGGSLSQGQKQLLCIARVMLCLPPMLILDEATSSIDTRTEMQIQEAFERMMQGRTSFIVAHRLSTIRDADVILVHAGRPHRGAGGPRDPAEKGRLLCPALSDPV